MSKQKADEAAVNKNLALDRDSGTMLRLKYLVVGDGSDALQGFKVKNTRVESSDKVEGKVGEKKEPIQSTEQFDQEDFEDIIDAAKKSVKKIARKAGRNLTKKAYISDSVKMENYLKNQV